MASHLDETLSLVAPSGARVALVERGAELPLAKEETLGTARDDQPSIAATLADGKERACARVEVEVRRAPRGVSTATLRLTIDEDGRARVELRAAGSSAFATFGLAVRSGGPFR